jgi:hypothetical protein
MDVLLFIMPTLADQNESIIITGAAAAEYIISTRELSEFLGRAHSQNTFATRGLVEKESKKMSDRLLVFLCLRALVTRPQQLRNAQGIFNYPLDTSSTSFDTRRDE